MVNLPETNSMLYQKMIARIRKYITIHTLIRGKCSCWYIGLTSDPAAALKSHQNQPGFWLRNWHCWEVENDLIAWSAQNYFRGRGMRTSDVPEETGADAKHLYIFKTSLF